MQMRRAIDDRCTQTMYLPRYQLCKCDERSTIAAHKRCIYRGVFISYSDFMDFMAFTTLIFRCLCALSALFVAFIGVVGVCGDRRSLREGTHFLLQFVMWGPILGDQSWHVLAYSLSVLLVLSCGASCGLLGLGFGFAFAGGVL